MKILLAVDGSPHAVKATRKVLELAARMSEPVQIVPIHVHLPLPRAGAVRRVLGSQVVQRYYREEAEAAVLPSLRLLKKAGYASQPVFKVGPIAETITEYARSGQADLIALGTRGMTATANLLLGSVATKVLHLASVPVLTVR